MDELKELMEGLKREISLLKELVKAKDELIQAMKFQTPIVIREMPQITIPFMQPVQPYPYQPVLPGTGQPPWQPPFTITSENIPGNPAMGCGPVTNAGNPTNGLYLVNSKAK